MSKIVPAINAMISNEILISNVIKSMGTEELFFTYYDKYSWSMNRVEDEYNLFYYPGNPSPSYLATLEGYEWEQIPMVRYSSKEIGTREAKASFAELYALLNELAFGMKDVLQDIIDSESPF